MPKALLRGNSYFGIVLGVIHNEGRVSTISTMARKWRKRRKVILLVQIKCGKVYIGVDMADVWRRSSDTFLGKRLLLYSYG